MASGEWTLRRREGRVEYVDAPSGRTRAFIFIPRHGGAARTISSMSPSAPLSAVPRSSESRVHAHRPMQLQLLLQSSPGVARFMPSKSSDSMEEEPA